MSAVREVESVFLVIKEIVNFQWNSMDPKFHLLWSLCNKFVWYLDGIGKYLMKSSLCDLNQFIQKTTKFRGEKNGQTSKNRESLVYMDRVACWRFGSSPLPRGGD